jgi:hypothetical protein
MDEEGILTDAELAAIEAWDRQQRSKKRRIALAMVAALALAFGGAALLGRSVRAEAAPPQVAAVHSPGPT